MEDYIKSFLWLMCKKPTLTVISPVVDILEFTFLLMASLHYISPSAQ